ncbi:MAG: porin family protein [Gammaproteobacteria bacterium]|nr:porin family protein [Gammaproteobacteria bacterium]
MTYSKSISVWALCAALLATSAVAETRDDPWYVGPGFFLLDYTQDPNGRESSFNGANVRFGRFFTENLSAEARIGVGIGGEDSGFEAKNYQGAYARWGVSATQTLYPYGILGYSRAKAKGTGTESGFSYGFGVDFRLEDGIDINVEYLALLDTSDVELEGLLLSFTKSF